MSSDTDDTTETEPTTIRRGRDFEREYRLSAADAGEFLVQLGEQLRDDETLTVADETEGWELPFESGEPVGLEIDFEGTGEPELEIEVEMPGVADDDGPTVS
ncbi:amphi-Trp domain-containing protein [Halobacteriales archaeon QS_8_69_73]|nr:MAG: amphi-Trp domain-containing protein [Halobacteriales archaeon QS_8_69_73]